MNYNNWITYSVFPILLLYYGNDTKYQMCEIHQIRHASFSVAHIVVFFWYKFTPHQNNGLENERSLLLSNTCEKKIKWMSLNQCQCTKFHLKGHNEVLTAHKPKIWIYKQQIKNGLNKYLTAPKWWGFRLLSTNWLNIAITPIYFITKRPIERKWNKKVLHKTRQKSTHVLIHWAITIDGIRELETIWQWNQFCFWSNAKQSCAVL